MSWESPCCPWGVPGEPRGSISGAWRPPGGAPGGYRGSLGGPWGAPGGSLEDPAWVLGAALGDFWRDRGEQAPKKWRGSMIATLLVPKRVPKWSPRGVILGVKSDPKSHRIFNAILKAILRVAGHPRWPKSCIFIGGLFKIEGRPFCPQAPPRSILEAILAPKRVSES